MIKNLAQWRRGLNLFGFGVCALLIAIAYYLQFVEHMEPCPLCIFQRVALAALGLVFLAAALQHPRDRGRFVYAALLLLFTGIGIALAGRHIWLQSLPPELVPACGPGLNYLLDVFPLAEVVEQVLAGSGECAEVDKVLGLSIPIWTLMAFIGLGGAGIVVNLLPAGRRRAS